MTRADAAALARRAGMVLALALAVAALDFVFRDLVGISDADMQRYAERGVFG